jgi:hypothetical protein
VKNSKIFFQHPCHDLFYGSCPLMVDSQLPEIKTLRRTLLKWRVEILNYFILHPLKPLNNESGDLGQALEPMLQM